jgi:hypothetical protein
LYNEKNPAKRGTDMLFRKKIECSCYYCAHGTKIDEELILCIKKGVVSAEKPCRKFCYDPTKRIPPKQIPLDVSRFDKEDFSL